MQLLGLLLFGTAIGAVSGLLGIGGGVLLIPGLMLLFGFTQAQAQGTSLAAMIPPIGLFAAAVYYKAGHVQLPVAAAIAGGFAGGAYLGALLVPFVPPTALRLGFGLLLLYVGFLFVLSPGGRSSAAMPAGVAAVATAAIGIVLRRRKPAKEPADGDIEFHI